MGQKLCQKGRKIYQTDKNISILSTPRPFIFIPKFGFSVFNLPSGNPGRNAYFQFMKLELKDFGGCGRNFGKLHFELHQNYSAYSNFFRREES
jgi:hypothetical protein